MKKHDEEPLVALDEAAEFDEQQYARLTADKTNARATFIPVVPPTGQDGGPFSPWSHELYEEVK